MTFVYPRGDRVLIKQIKKEEQKIGKIILPSTTKESYIEAVVVAIGAGKKLENGARQAIDLRPGDVVVVSEYAGVKIKVDGVEHIVVHDDDILASIQS